MKKLLILIIVASNLMSYSQTKHDVQSKVVLKNSNDTLLINVFARGKKEIDERYFTDGILYYEGRNKFRIEPKDIEYIEFIDHSSKKRRIVSYSKIKSQQSENQNSITLSNNKLYEEIIAGKISWYKKYNTNAYDGSIVLVYIFIKDGEVYYLHFLKRFKKNIIKLIEDNDELTNIVEKTKFSGSISKRDIQVLDIISRYNSNYKEKNN